MKHAKLAEGGWGYELTEEEKLKLSPTQGRCSRCAVQIDTNHGWTPDGNCLNDLACAVRCLSRSVLASTL